MSDVTQYRNYKRIRADGKTPGKDIAQELYDMVTEIDLDVQNIVDAQDVINDDVQSDLTTVQADIDVLGTDLATVNTARIDGDKNTEFSKVDSSITRDGGGRITGIVEGNKTTSLITYNVDGTINTWREVITLSTGAVTRNWTATYSGGYYTGKTFTS